MRKGVQQPRGTDHARSVLVIMKTGMSIFFFQAPDSDDEKLRRLDYPPRFIPGERRGVPSVAALMIRFGVLRYPVQCRWSSRRRKR